ncbi:MAG: sulfate transporter CysZ [Pseudomonadota bacterium]
MNGSISNGAGYFLRGVQLLKHPRLRPFVLIPLGVNILIFGAMIGYSVHWINATLTDVIGWLPGWLTWLTWLIWPLVVISLGLITGYFFTAVALLIASPFNGLLAEKVEEIVTGREVQGPETIAQAFLMFPRAIVRELGKLAYYLPLLLLVFIVSWIPPFNLVAPALWFLFGAWMMAVQYVDYPMDNHMTSFTELKEVLRERRLSSLGFGGLVALVSGVPVLNFFVVPAAVCGATLYWCEELTATHQRLHGRL